MVQFGEIAHTRIHIINLHNYDLRQVPWVKPVVKPSGVCDPLTSEFRMHGLQQRKTTENTLNLDSVARMHGLQQRKTNPPEEVPLVEFMYLVFTRMPCESYRSRLSYTL